MGQLSLDQIIKKIEELPPLSQVTLDILKLTSNPKTSIDELAQIIIRDQVLSARLLKMANSAYYGYSRKIYSINEAIMILGFSNIRSLVIATSVSHIMDKELSGYYMVKGELWKHSIATALLARELAKMTGKVDPNLAFTAGLLNDIGKVVLNSFMELKFQDVIEKVQTSQVPFMDAEAEILGYNHAQVGAQVAEKWKLPVVLVETIAHHHNPSKAVINPDLTAIIHVADSLSMSLGYGLGGDGMLYPFDNSAIERLSLHEKDLYQTAGELLDNLPEAENLFSAS